MADRGEAADRSRHQLTLKARQHLEISGVVHVESFDDHEMVLETDLGILVVRGEGMQILAFDVQEGTMTLAGTFNTFEYAGESAHKRARGLLGRLMR